MPRGSRGRRSRAPPIVTRSRSSQPSSVVSAMAARGGCALPGRPVPLYVPSQGCSACGRARPGHGRGHAQGNVHRQYRRARRHEGLVYAEYVCALHAERWRWGVPVEVDRMSAPAASCRNHTARPPRHRRARGSDAEGNFSGGELTSSETWEVLANVGHEPSTLKAGQEREETLSAHAR